MSIRTIEWPEDRDAILDHIYQVHGSQDYEALATWYGSFPNFDPADCFVIDGDYEDEIAAHAMLVPRMIQIGNSLLPTAEVSTVGTLEPYRRQGFARALLDVLHTRMHEKEFALGLMFGLPSFYEAWQYEYAVGLYLTSYESDIAVDMALKAGHWDMVHSYQRRTADRLMARNQPVSIRRFYVDDLPAVNALYTAESARGHYLIARDETTWRWQLDMMTRIGRNDPDDFLVAEIDGQITAYARLVTQEPVNWFRDNDAARFSVIEAAGEHPDAIDALLVEIARTAQAFGIDRIGLFVHPESTFMKHALVHGGSLRTFTGAGFVRLHNLPLTLELLVPTLEARRLNSPFASRGYRLIVSTEYEQVEVELGMGSLEEVALEAPSTSLLRLITGWYGIDHLNNGFHERYYDLLRVLFPRRDPKIALADLM
ncbi:MAG: GNAT family N-acetyltransferase [Anaerolineae bacterium]|nr:GNAT family N-acetyltransferase [Anaerolineae bacterium]